MADLSAFTHLLSRYYLVGFALPIYAWLAVLDLALEEKEWKPDYF